MESTTVSIRNGMFSTHVMKGGTGSPLLYLHGETGVDESAFLEGLGTTFSITAPRHPGFGESSGDENLQDLQDLVFYYLDFLDSEGLRNLPIVGHGLGGMFALELAATQPERFTKVAAIAPFGLWNSEHPVPDFFVYTPDEVIKANFHDPSSEAAEALAMPQTEGDMKPLLERVKSQRVAAKYLWPIPNRGLSKRIHRITQPALLVWGESDGIVPPQYANDFVQALPNATAKTIKQAAHLPQLEKTEELTKVLTEFLS